MNTILAIDDEHEQLRILDHLLKAEYNFFGFQEANSIFEQISHFRPDLILLDKYLGQVNSIEVIKEIRSSKHCNIPIVMITGDDNDESLEEALNCGADDFIPKPFTFTELKARIKAALRRGGALRNDEQIQFKGFSFDKKNQKILIGMNEIHLTGIERQILTVLAEKIDIIVNRSLLFKSCKITGLNKEISLNVHICTLRKKIKEHGFIIKTIRNEGYVLTTDSNF